MDNFLQDHKIKSVFVVLRWFSKFFVNYYLILKILPVTLSEALSLVSSDFDPEKCLQGPACGSKISFIAFINFIFSLLKHA
jgi:hypothetical protein